jgi:predicted GNAT family acetyltransferase
MSARLPNDLVITLQALSGGGRYVARTSEGPDSEMTFQRRPGRIVIDHTGVPRELEGRGIAAALLARAIEDARALGHKITPRCSYVVAQAARHKEWADVFAND